MNQVLVYTDSITVRLDTGPDIVDVTGALDRVIKQSKIADGNLAAAVVGSTGSLTTIEYEPGVVADLKEAINRIAPPGNDYAHEEAWHDGNGHSHVQAALLGPSISLPVRGGKVEARYLAAGGGHQPRQQTQAEKGGNHHPWKYKKIISSSFYMRK